MMKKVQFPLETSNFARAHKELLGGDVQLYSSRYLIPPTSIEKQTPQMMCIVYIREKRLSRS